MSDNTKRPEDKPKKNKNKNKKKEGNANPSANLSSALGGLDTSIFDKFNQLMAQEKPVDFEKFNECEKRVREEMESIQIIISNIQGNKFDEFPDEPKKEPAAPVPNRPELDAHRKKLLSELNKKIVLFEEKLQKIEALEKENESDPHMITILQGVKENLTDDIRRNKDLYRRFESTTS